MNSHQCIFADLPPTLKVGHNFKSYAPVELGTVVLVKLNGIFLCQMMSAGTFVLYTNSWWNWPLVYERVKKQHLHIGLPIIAFRASKQAIKHFHPSRIRVQFHRPFILLPVYKKKLGRFATKTKHSNIHKLGSFVVHILVDVINPPLTQQLSKIFHYRWAGKLFLMLSRAFIS